MKCYIVLSSTKYDIVMSEVVPIVSVKTTKDRAKRKLERDAGIIVSALQDPETVEVMVNADGRIWQERSFVSAAFRLRKPKRSS